MRTLVALLLLATLGACSSGGAEPVVPPVALPKAGKLSPYAPPPPPMPEEGIVCPADVMQCPDGSFVSRSPARGCAFDACPSASKP
ncbi:MAG: hypothetical protein WCB97_04415 [Thiobacillus sp.]